MCDSDPGLINRGGGVVVDAQPDLHHARRMIGLFGRVWPGMPKWVIITHEAGDTIVHVPADRVVFAGDVIFRRCAPPVRAHGLERNL